MTKFLKSLILPLLLVASLTGCTKNNEKPTSSEEEVSSEEISSEETSSLPEWVNYIDREDARLNRDYEGRDFFVDGIGEVTLRMNIDGDTAHFDPVVTTTSSVPIKSRFYGIDTPESTGRIQEYGQAASNFTKSKLNNAKANGTIVVSAAREDYGTPEHDSTGERFLSLIWINETVKNAPYESLVLLNLYIVQEGYSWVKNVEELPSFRDVFYAAEAQAKAYKLNLFSGVPDPDYPRGDFIVTSLLDFKLETERCIADPTYVPQINNVKVCFEGAVAGYSDGTIYIQDYFSEENGGRNGGEYAGINGYCGASAISEKFTTFNTYLRLYGVAKYSENFGYQITNLEGHFKPYGAKQGDVEIIIKAEDNVDEHSMSVIEYTADELKTMSDSASTEALYCRIKITEPLTCRSFYINDAGTEITLRFEGFYSFSFYITGNYKGDSERPQYVWKTESDFVGKKFLAEGVYSYHRTTSGNITWQLVFCNLNQDLVWVQE